MCTLTACVNNPSNINDVILLHSYEESHGIVITLRCFKQVSHTHPANPAMQGTQHEVLLIS